MPDYTPSSDEQLAVEAKLNMLLGTEIYDSLFLGFRCGDVIDGVALVYAHNVYYANQIEARYSSQIAQSIESVLNCRISLVNVLPRDFSDAPVDISAIYRPRNER